VRLRRAKSSVLAIAALVAVGGTAAGVARLDGGSTHGEPVTRLPRGFSSWDDVFAVQNPLNQAGLQIERAAGARRGSGYTSYVVDVVDRHLTLYWHGRPSAAEQRVIAAVRGRGVHVVLRPARYSGEQLAARRNLIERDAGAHGARRILRITTSPDGSGIRVGLSAAAERVATTGTQSDLLRAVGDYLPHLRTAVAMGGVTVEDAAPASQFAAREADIAPYWGGSLIRSNAGDACSTGFAANWPATGQTYVITAAHCGEIGSVWQTLDGSFHNNYFLGEAVGNNKAYDAMFIDTTSYGGSQGYVYNGPRVFQSGQYGLPVVGATHVGNGDYVCTSGAMTGTVCNIQVLNAADVDCRNPSLGCVNVIDAALRDPQIGQMAAMEGDSGGPVVIPTAGGNAELAVGLISGAEPGQPTYLCGNPIATHYSGKSFGFLTCSRNIEFTDVLDAIAPFSGLRITTTYVGGQ
jgi:hypothetical protein